MAGSDEKNEGGAGEVLDASDLKARLGLKRRVNKPTGPPPGAAPTAASATPADDGAAAQAAVEEARARAEAELAKAGPAVEDFGLMGQDRTPAPGPLPGADLDLKGLDVVPGQGKGKLVQLLVVAAVVGLLAFVLGRIMGSAMGEREAHNAAVFEAKDKLKYFQEAKTTTGGSKINKLIEIQAALAGAAKDIDAVAATINAERPFELVDKLEPILAPLIEKLQGYHGENVAFAIDDAVGRSAANPEIAADVARFALSTQLLHERLGLTLDEAKTLLPLTLVGEGAVERNLAVERFDRPVGEVKIPVARGLWLASIGQMEASAIPDPANPQNQLTAYKMKVKAVGAKEEIEIVSTDFMRLDLKPIFEEQAQSVKLVAYNRLATAVKELEKVAAAAKWDALQKKLQEHSQQETY